MSDILLSPPLAFLVFVGIAGLLSIFGRVLAGPEVPSSALKKSIYSSGEEAPRVGAAPGYRQFFVIALFFAVLHLGVLIIGSGGLNWIAGVYLVGLLVALLALIMG